MYRLRLLFPTALTLLAACAPEPSEHYDVILRAGHVIDGTGSAPRRADVGIRGDTIVAVGEIAAGDAGRVIDVGGLIVAPGFIDMHSHSDYTLLVDGRGLSKVMQGVTTELLGESSSAGPVLGAAREDREKSLAQYELELDWATLGEYFERLERSGTSVNILSTVASGLVRASVVGYEDREATEEELERMETLVEEAMRDGASSPALACHQKTTNSSILTLAPSCQALVWL